MASSEACAERDWAARRVGLVLWRLPIVVLLLGAGLGSPWHAVLWTLSFGVMGTACVVNAVRCGRLHCVMTGPLFLAAAVASALREAGFASPSWTTLAVAVVAGVLAAHVPEWVRGKYVAPVRTS
jgi:hypothetical protein